PAWHIQRGRPIVWSRRMTRWLLLAVTARCRHTAGLEFLGSAWVGAESAMQSSTEPFLWCAPQVQEDMEDSGHVHARMPRSDDHGAPPQRLRIARCATLIFGQSGGHSCHSRESSANPWR